MPDLTALNTFAAYWVLATWVVGALVISLGFGMALVALGSIALEKWSGTFHGYHQSLWVYRAIRAYERAGHRRPGGATTINASYKLSSMARSLIEAAQQEGMVVTIETMPLAPLAMGNYYMQHDVREARSENRTLTAQPAQAGADRAGGLSPQVGDKGQDNG